MVDRVLVLCRRLDEVREQHEAFHDTLDAPLEPGTPEFDHANGLLQDVNSLLEELADACPETADGATAMAAAVLAHAGDLRPSVYRMLAHIHCYLSGHMPEYTPERQKQAR